MRLLVVGRGPWGNAYARAFERLNIPYWQATHDWHCYVPDGVIVATPAETHYAIARCCLGRKIPVLVEKPVALSGAEAHALAGMGGIGFAGHTRLHSPAWRAFKASLPKVESVEAWAGGTDRDPWWDWGPHLVAMSLDIGCEKPVIHVTQEERPLRFVVNGEHEFRDVPDNPLDELICEFCAAIERGEPNNEGLRLGARVIDYLESECPLQT